jgi:hypothetical protein
MKNAIKILFLVSVFTVNTFAQMVEADAQVPVLVNVAANVTIAPPAVSRGMGEEADITANAEKVFNIKLIGLPGVASSVSHRSQTKAGVGAQISRSRGNVTLNLQPQQYQNAAISLYSINGRRILSDKASASSGALNISRSNIPAGIYVLSVKGTNGNSFASRITHSGSRLNINVAFSGMAGPLLSKSMVAGGEYGEWTINVTAPGHITQSRKFSPVAETNPLEEFTLVPVTQTERANFTDTVNGVSFDMVYVSGGSFTLGCVGSGCPPNTTPVDATVSPYFIGSATVTRNLWQAVMGTVPSGFGTSLMITWYDALEFACKLSQITGKNYRMMTEAEFEYAAKNHLSSLTLTTTEEWAYNTWAASHSGGTNPVGPGSGTHNQKTRRNARVGDPIDNITGRLIRSIEGIGPALRLTLSADGSLPPDYVHPCRLYAPKVNVEPTNSYRDMRWVTGSGARWTTPSGAMGGLNLRIWEDGTATSTTTWGGRETVTPGQWFTSNNITFVFVPNTGSITRYAYIFLKESDASYISESGGSGRLVMEAANHVDKPVISNLRSGEDLAKSQPDFDTFYKMVDMVNMPVSARRQDERLLDGPEHGWLQINTGATHHYRKDVDPDEFRFIVSGANLAMGEWFTINNTFLRVIDRGFEQTCTGWPQTCVDDPNRPFEYMVDYLYVITSGSGQLAGRFMHNSFMGYERADMRMFEKLENSSSRISAIANQCAQCVGEIAKGQNISSMYRNDERFGHSTFVPAPCPAGGC